MELAVSKPDDSFKMGDNLEKTSGRPETRSISDKGKPLSPHPLLPKPGSVSHSSNEKQQETEERDVEYNGRNNRNLFIAARGHVQRVIDVALVVSNMSRLAGIIKRRNDYYEIQMYILSSSLVASLIAQVIAGVFFFADYQREINNKEHKSTTNYIAYACVAIVIILNIFVAAFDISLSPVAHSPSLPDSAVAVP